MLYLEIGKIYESFPVETKISEDHSAEMQLTNLKSQVVHGHLSFYPDLKVIHQFIAQEEEKAGGTDKISNVWQDFKHSEQAFLIQPKFGANEYASKHGYTWNNEFATPAGGVDYCIMKVNNLQPGMVVVAFRFGIPSSDILLIWLLVIKNSSSDFVAQGKIISPPNKGIIM